MHWFILQKIEVDDMINIAYKSTWSKPNLGDWWYTSVQLVIHIFWQFIVKLIFGFVHSVSGMSPPSVQETEEEHWVNESGVKVRSMDVEHTISFKWWWWSAPKLSVLRKWSCLWNQAFIISHLTWNIFRDEWFRNLNFTCIQSNVFLSSSVKITKFRSLLFEFDFENWMSVAEV